MKKALLFLVCLLLFSGSVMGCSDGGWPKQVTQGDWTVTKLEEEPPTYTRFLDYILPSIEEETENANLIIKAEISEPVYYEVKESSDWQAHYLGYKVVARKVYYSDDGIRDGDTVRFLRLMQKDPVWKTLSPGDTVVLFLTFQRTEYDPGPILAQVAEYECGCPSASFAGITDDYIEELVDKYKKPQEGTP